MMICCVHKIKVLHLQGLEAVLEKAVHMEEGEKVTRHGLLSCLGCEWIICIVMIFWI